MSTWRVGAGAPQPTLQASSLTHARQASRDQLTPRSVIAPPSLSPAASPAGGGSFLTSTGALFAPGAPASFAILTSEHWQALQTQYKQPAELTHVPAGIITADVSGFTSIVGSAAPSGYASPVEEGSDNEDQPSAARYQSRVRGPRPTRPSSISLALAASRADSVISNEAAQKVAEAVAAEKARSHCLECVLSLSQCAPELFASRAWSFLPADSQSALARRPFGGPSLVTVLLHDPSARVRAMAAQCLSSLLVDSPITRWTGAIADVATTSGPAPARIRKNRESQDKKTGAFTSLSVRFADTLRGLHSGLLESLKKESHASVLPHVLKAISVLALNTPYQTVHRTPSASTAASAGTTDGGGLLGPIVDQLLTHMLHEASSYAAKKASAAAAAATAAAAAALAAASATPAPPRLRTTRVSLPPAASSTAAASASKGDASANTSSSGLRHAIFTCLASIFDTTSVADELRPFLAPAPSGPGATPRAYLVEAIPLLLGHARARQPADPTPDAFTLLAKIARHYPTELGAYWQPRVTMGASLAQLLRDCLGCATLGATADHTIAQQPSALQDVQTKLLALRIIEEWNKHDSGSGGGGDGDDEDDAGGGQFEPSSTGASGFFALDGARTLLAVELPLVYAAHGSPAAPASGSLTPAEVHAWKQHAVSLGNVRAKILACLALLPFDQWEAIAPQHQQVMLRLALDAAQDDTAAVRAAACRCLCLFALYAARMVPAETAASTNTTNAALIPMSARSYVISSVSRLLDLLDPATSPGLAVRVKAAWSLAHIVDFGHAESDDVDDGDLPPMISPATPRLHELVPAELFHRLVEGVLASTRDSEKVLVHSVRAVGILARWYALDSVVVGVPAAAAASSATASTLPLPVLQRMVTALVTSVRSARGSKSRWNACLAIGNVLRNTQLPSLVRRDVDARNHIDDALRALLELVSDSAPPQSPAATAGGDAAPKQANFKVRIHAASALSAAPSKAHYASSFTVMLSSLLGLAASLDVACSGASVHEGGTASPASFKDFRYLSQLRQALIGTVCHMLGRSDERAASDSDGEDAPVAVDSELVSLYGQQWPALARILLGERLRWEKESKLVERAERLAAQAVADPQVRGSRLRTSGASAPAAGAPAPVTPLLRAVPKSASKSAIARGRSIVDRATSSVARVLLALDGAAPASSISGGGSGSLSSTFTAEANGESPFGGAVDDRSEIGGASTKTMQ